MKKILILSLCLISFTVQSKEGLRPGLWKISFKIKTDGHIIEPAEELKRTINQLPADEREDFKSALREHAGMDEDGKINVCYSSEDFQQQEASISPMGDNCLSKVIKNTSSKVITNFFCLDGISGTNTWFIKGPGRYEGVTKLIRPGGEASEIIYEGKFFSSLCETIDDVVI